MDAFWQLLIIASATIYLGYMTYRAWFQPEEYRRTLQKEASWWKWYPGANDWLQSDTLFWLNRIGALIFFCITIVALVITALRYLR